MFASVWLFFPPLSLALGSLSVTLALSLSLPAGRWPALFVRWCERFPESTWALLRACEWRVYCRRAAPERSNERYSVARTIVKRGEHCDARPARCFS